MVKDREPPIEHVIEFFPPKPKRTPYQWYWQLPVRWEPWWDTNFDRWLVIAFPAHAPTRSVFYIWLSENPLMTREDGRRHAEEVAAALTRIYGA